MIRWAAVAWAMGLAAPAVADCRQALLLALDVSGSVDAAEYRLQMDGLATALVDDAVVQAFLAVPAAPVSLGVFEWSSTEYQALIVDWTPITSRADLAGIAGGLHQHQRSDTPQSTGLAGTLTYAQAMFDRAPGCWQHTLDISADGQNNDWPAPEVLLQDGVLATTTINVLAIRGPLPGARTPELGLTELVDYFRRKIVQGPGSFVETASGYQDYARSMRRKLLRELSIAPVGSLPGSPRRHAKSQ